MLVTPEPDIPIPTERFNFSKIPVLERARLACATMQALWDTEGVVDGEETDEEKDIARAIFKEVTAETPQFHITAVDQYPNNSMRYLDKMLSEYDHELVNSAVRIREYVKNKLMIDSENPDGRIRIKALELLGKMKDVGLFTDRVEITHKNKTDEELEVELTKKIERYMGVVIEAEPEPVEEEEYPEEDAEYTEEDVQPADDVINFISNLASE
jgi:hypothetical protein